MWIHRLQEYAAITRAECTFLIATCLLFAVGLATRHLIEPTVEVPEYSYAETDSLFGHATRQPFAESGRLPSAHDTSYTSLTGSLKLDLNTASIAELEQLPRIGPVMAARIVAYREAHGRFHEVRELLEVSGIGNATLERIEPYLYVEK
jgi:competence ComEA-like helix-hairpin-helix protein